MNRRPKNTVTLAILQRIGRGSIAARELAVLYPNPEDHRRAVSWAKVMVWKLQDRGLLERVTDLARPATAARRGPYGEWKLTRAGLIQAGLEQHG